MLLCRSPFPSICQQHTSQQCASITGLFSRTFRQVDKKSASVSLTRTLDSLMISGSNIPEFVDLKAFLALLVSFSAPKRSQRFLGAITRNRLVSCADTSAHVPSLPPIAHMVVRRFFRSPRIIDFSYLWRCCASPFPIPLASHPLMRAWTGSQGVRKCLPS